MTSSQSSSETTSPMATPCPFAEAGDCPFPEEQLSGAIDGVLTRVQSARVQQRIQECPRCRELFEDLSLNREAARSTTFRVPPDDQWDETPRGWVSAGARNVGLGLFAVLTLVCLFLAVVQPSFFDHRWTQWLVRIAVAATLAVLVSAAVDRWRASRRDLYRGVKR